jgi:hypothetical protein
LISDPYLLFNNLNINNNGMPQLFANLSKNSTIPDVIGGTLFTDQVNKVFYQFGGGYHEPPQTSNLLYSFDAILNQWNQTSLSDHYNHVSWGAGVSVNERAEGYYFGGWMNGRRTSGGSAYPRASGNLIRYDMIGNTFTNNSGLDNTGRAEGVMVYIPASDNGLLIYFGGILDPSHNGTIVESPMRTILIYDILSAQWYNQTATGDIPAARRRFCAVLFSLVPSE